MGLKLLVEKVDFLFELNYGSSTVELGDDYCLRGRSRDDFRRFCGRSLLEVADSLELCNGSS